jgi:hypothetical protein
MNKFLMLLAVAGGLLLSSGSILAHHGDAGRYEDNVIVMSGTVVELQFTDPHAIIVLDVTDNGKTTRWQAELGGRGALTRVGWTKNTLKPGDKITMTGRRVKSGAPYMNLTDRANVVLSETGKEVFKTDNFGTEERKRPAAQLNQ